MRTVYGEITIKFSTQVKSSDVLGEEFHDQLIKTCIVDLENVYDEKVTLVADEIEFTELEEDEEEQEHH